MALPWPFWGIFVETFAQGCVAIYHTISSSALIPSMTFWVPFALFFSLICFPVVGLYTFFNTVQQHCGINIA